MNRLQRLCRVVAEEQKAAKAQPTRENLDALKRTQGRLFNYAFRSGRQESVPYELFFAPPETDMVATGFGWRKQLKKKVDLSDF